MKRLIITSFVIQMIVTVTSIQAAVITEARRIVGTTPGEPEIVLGPSPSGLQEGSHAYMDRPSYAGDIRNYHWEDIPAELVGADYIMTYNQDKHPEYSNAYDVSYSVTLAYVSELYIFIDHRYVQANGSPPFIWMEDGSVGVVFTDTGFDINLNEVGGRNVLQPFDVYGAEVPAGTYTFGASCDGISDRNFYAIAAKRILTPVITEATRIVGTTPGEPEIVLGPSPGGLQEGSHAYMDRPLYAGDSRNYHWEDIPPELVGADYVITYNEDKRPEYSTAYDISYSVTLAYVSKLYIFIDHRYVQANGSPPFIWMEDGSAGVVFTNTGLDINLNEVGGRNVLQPFDIYGAEVPSGTYTFGASCDGIGDRNFYAIAAKRIRAPIITEATRIVGTTPGEPEIVLGPSPGGLQEGSHAYMDRPMYAGDSRNYHWEDIPPELVGADYVITYNEDKRLEYGNIYGDLYSVKIAYTAELYVFIDHRYVQANGSPPFIWMEDGSAGVVFMDTGLDINLNEVGGRNVLQPFDVYGAEVPAGIYNLGTTYDGDDNRNFYAIAAVALNIEDFESGFLSALHWEHEGNAFWHVTASEAYSGRYSARAGAIGNYESSVLKITRECVAGEISFAVKVSSERSYDKLFFLIDNNEIDNWHGDISWVQVTYPVSSGTHTFKWRYAKDSSLSRGEDTAWLDNIHFPAP